MSNSGPTVEIGGNIAIAKAPARTTRLARELQPGDRVGAKEASMIAIAVAISAIPIELISGLMKGLSEIPPSNSSCSCRRRISGE